MGTVVALPVALLTGRPEGSTSELAAALGAAALGFGAGALYFVALQHGQLLGRLADRRHAGRGGGARGGAAARRAARRGARGRPPGRAGRDGARRGRARRRRPPGARAGGRLRHRPRVLRRGPRRDGRRGRRHVGRARLPRAHARGPAAARRCGTGACTCRATTAGRSRSPWCWRRSASRRWPTRWPRGRSGRSPRSPCSTPPSPSWAPRWCCTSTCAASQWLGVGLVLAAVVVISLSREA